MTDENDVYTEELDLNPPDESPEDLEPESPEEELEEELDETEFEGKKYRVPKELKDALLRQADYTRKTQEVAEIRRAAESERAAIKQAVEADEAADELKADLRTVDKALKSFENVDWSRFAADSPAQAQAYMLQYQQLQMQRQQLSGGLEQLEHTSRTSREQAHSAALAQAKADLLQAMPDFTQELAVKITQSTVSAYGFSPDELSRISDPRQVRILRDAMMWRESQLKARQAAKPTPATEPVRTVRASSKATVNPDKMTTAQWMEYERNRIAKKGK